MSHVEYSPKASERMRRANHIAVAARIALARNNLQFTERAQWAAYVFAFFVVTLAAVFAVASVWP